MTTYTCWAGYFEDHLFDPGETDCTWQEARDGVHNALYEAGHDAQAEYDADPSDSEWQHWRDLYAAALDILEATTEGANFDVTIRGERFAVVPTEGIQ